MKKILAGLFAGILLVSATEVLAFSRKPKPAPVSIQSEKKYMCPMRCAVYSQPGKCGKCGMELWKVSSHAS